jgi:hypothetical protein
MSRDYDDDRDDDLEDRERDERDDRDDARSGGSRAAMDRVNVPGILLIVVGILNLLAGGWSTFRGVMVLSVDKAAAAQAQQQLTEQQKKEMEQLGWSVEGMVQKIGGGILVIGIIGLLIGAINIAGGVRMRSLQGYGLAVLAAILAMIPCVSGVACCGLGEVAGIWALIVLLSPDVKSQFR